MKITKIVTTNTNGRNIDQELSGRDLFTGPNGSGKTTRLESVMVGIQGYVPSRGKTPADLFTMSSGEEMSVSLTTESGFSCTRSVKEKVTRRRSTGEKTYSLTTNTSVFPPRSEKTEAQKKARIDEELGDFPLMFNLDEFFGLSDDRKRAFIFGLTDPAKFGWDKTRIMSEIKDGFSDEEILASLSAIWDDTASVQDNMVFMIDWVKGQISEAKSQLKAATNSKQQLLEQKQSIGSNVRPRQQIKAEIDTLRGNVDELNRTIAANQEKKKLLAQLQKDKESMDRVNNETLPGPKDLSKLDAERLKLRGQIEDAKERTERLRKKRSELSTTLTELRTEKRSLGSRLDSITQSLGMCPLTGKECPSFEDLDKFRDELKSSIEDIGKKLESQAKLIEETDELGLVAATGLKEVEAKHSEILEVISQEKVLVERRKAAEKAKQDLENINSRIASMVIEDLTMQETTRIAQMAQLEQLQKELEGDQEVHDLNKAFDRANIEAVGLEDRIEKLEDLAILMGTGRIQGDILADTVTPILEKVNSLLKKTDECYNLSLDLYDKNDRPIFNLMWKKGAFSIPFESLSGGEKCVFSVALLCALVLAKDPPVKVLCLEASEVDRKNLGTLLSAIDDFGSEIDNFLVATHITPPGDVPSWQVHALG